MVIRALISCLFILITTNVSACRLALIMALDVSSSVDEAEHLLQRQGTVNALISPNVQAAFFASQEPVALAVFEWSGRFNQTDLLNWTMISAPEDLVSAAERILSAPRSHNDFPTAMGHALGQASIRLANGPVCLDKTIDLAGDGINNDGYPPQSAYRAFPFEGVTVNGLVILDAQSKTDAELIPFYRNQVIRGPGAFIEIAEGFDDYAAALERKLVRELTSFAVGNLPAASRDQG